MTTPIARFDADGVPLRAPSALSLDGVDDYLYRSEAIASSFPYSVAFWVRVPSGAVGWIFGQYFLSSYGNYLYLTDGTLTAYSDHRPGDVYEASGADASGSLAADTWHLVVAVWASSSSRKLSIDGGAFAEDTTDIDAQSPMTGTTIGGFGSHASGVTGQMAVDVDNLGIWGRALSDTEPSQLYASGAGLSYDDLDSGLLDGLASWHELGESGGPRVDMVGRYALYPSGGPASTPGHAPDDATARARNGDRVASVGDAEAEGDGPTFSDFPSRLAADADGPGMRFADSAPLVGSTFDLYFRAEDFHGAAGRLLTCVDGDGVVAAVDVDADGFFSYTIDDDSGDPATVPATVSAFGGAAVTGGSAANGTDRVALSLTISTRLDAGEGDHMTVSGCDDPFDAEHAVVLGYHWDESAGTGTIRYQGAEESSEGVVVESSEGGVAPAAGTVTLHGRFEETADQRPDGTAIAWCAGFRVKRSGGRVDFYRNEHHLGGGTLSASRAGDTGTGTLTVGVRDGDAETPVAWLPSRVEVYGSVLPDAESTSLLAALCRRPRVVDGYGGEVYRERIECLPGVWRQEMAHALIAHLVIDDATGQQISGESYNGDADGRAEGQASSVSLGTFLQSSTTTYSYEVHVASRAWDQAGDRATQTYLHRSVITATRRPWLSSTHVDPDQGADDTGDGSSGGPFKTINKAVAQSAPGTLIRVHATAACAPFAVDGDAASPIAVIPSDGSTPWEMTPWWNGQRESVANLVESRGLSVKGLKVVHLSGENAFGIDIPCQWSVGLSLIGIRDKNEESSEVNDLISANKPTDDLSVLDAVVEAGTDPAAHRISYPVIHGASARGLSIRRLRVGRMIEWHNGHPIRAYSQVYGETAGVTTIEPTEYDSQASLAFRASSTRSTVRDCTMPDHVLEFTAGQTIDANGNYSPGGLPVAQTRLLVARNQFYSIAVVGSCGGSRFSCNWVAVESPGPADSNPANSTVSEVQFPEDDSVVVEASTGTLLTDPGAVARAFPTSDSRACLVSSGFATGEAISAPTLSSLSGVPDGRAVAVMDELATGGTAPIATTAYLDDEPLSGAPGQLLVAVADSGSHTLRVDAGDGSSESATGTGLSVTVGGGAAAGGFLLVRVGSSVYAIARASS